MVIELNKALCEANTRRMMLHAKDAAADYDSIIIVADDTNVLMVNVAVQARIDFNMYTYGTRARTRHLMSRKCVQLLHKKNVLLC